jgi:hypothetical protein
MSAPAARGVHRVTPMSKPESRPTRPTLWARFVHELKAFWVIALYLSVFFGVFATFQRLMLAEYGIHYEDYGFAIVKGLVLAKVVLIADKMRLGGRFRGKPLSIPTLYNTIVFTVCATVVHFGEVAIRHLVHHGASGLGRALGTEFDYALLARGLVVFFGFIPFFAVRELERVLGEGKLSDMFFLKRRAA